VAKLTTTNNNQKKKKEPLTSPADYRHGIMNEERKSAKRMVTKVQKIASRAIRTERKGTNENENVNKR
jgi:hypothetical protein